MHRGFNPHSSVGLIFRSSYLGSFFATIMNGNMHGKGRGRPPTAAVAIKVEEDEEPVSPHREDESVSRLREETSMFHDDEGSNTLPDLSADSFDTNLADTFVSSYDSDGRTGPSHSLQPRDGQSIKTEPRENDHQPGIAAAKPSEDFRHNKPKSENLSGSDGKEGKVHSRTGLNYQYSKHNPPAMSNDFSFEEDLSGLPVDEVQRGEMPLPYHQYFVPMDGNVEDNSKWGHPSNMYATRPWDGCMHPSPMSHIGGSSLFQEPNHGFRQQSTSEITKTSATNSTASFHQQPPPSMVSLPPRMSPFDYDPFHYQFPHCVSIMCLDNNQHNDGQPDRKLPPNARGVGQQQHHGSESQPFLPDRYEYDGSDVARMPRTQASASKKNNAKKAPPKRKTSRTINKKNLPSKRVQKPRAAKTKKKDPPRPADSSSTTETENSLDNPPLYRQQGEDTERARKAKITWNQRLRELYDFKRKHKHTNVPQKYPENKKLGIWVNKQRMEYKFRVEGKISSMTDEKIKALVQAGFNWAKRKGEAAWDEKYKQLVKYKIKNGHCNVPTKCSRNTALGRWVSTQRSRYKRGKLPSDCVSKLDDIDFTWCMAPTNQSLGIGQNDTPSDDEEDVGDDDDDDVDDNEEGEDGPNGSSPEPDDIESSNNRTAI